MNIGGVGHWSSEDVTGFGLGGIYSAGIALGAVPSRITGTHLIAPISTSSITGFQNVLGDIVLTAPIATVAAIAVVDLVQPPIKATTYIVKIKADGYSEEIIPCSNISGKLLSTGISRLTIVMPNGVDYADIMSERRSGTFKILTTDTYLDNTTDTVTSDDYTIDSYRSDQGARSFSITVSGFANIVTSLAKRLTIKGVSYISVQADGTVRVRGQINKDIAPRDTVQYDGGNEVIISSVTYVIGSGKFMEVAG